MLKVSVDRILSVTEARRRLSELVDQATDDEFWVLTKRGKPEVALVDVAYLNQLVRRAWFNELTSQSQEAFESYLRSQGIDPDKINASEVEALLQRS